MGNILHRFILALIVLGLVAVVVFVLVELLTGDAATAYLGRRATPKEFSALSERVPIGREGQR